MSLTALFLVKKVLFVILVCAHNRVIPHFHPQTCAEVNSLVWMSVHSQVCLVAFVV